MPRFSALADDLAKIYCLPSVRADVVRLVDELRRGRPKVYQMSAEGVDHVLRRPDCHFQALFMVNAERCDRGDIHFHTVRRYCVLQPGPGDDLLDQLYAGIRGYAIQLFGDEDEPDLDEETIPLVGPMTIGAITYRDEDEPGSRTLIFGPPSMTARHLVALLCGAMMETTGEHDDDEED